MTDLEYYKTQGRQEIQRVVEDFFSSLPGWQNTVENANLVDSLTTKLDQATVELLQDTERELRKSIKNSE